MLTNSSPIGVFDSGVGGISVLNELRRLMPMENFIYYGDSMYAPYGEKSKEEIRTRCIHICEFFCKEHVKAIVIACNTATSACVAELRERYAQIPIIGMEPALKVAAEQDGLQHILVLATSFTLKEQKFANLMERYEKENVIYKQPCPKLVEIVEQRCLHDKERAVNTLRKYLSAYDLHRLDSIVLGCTHFVFYRNYLKEILPSHIQVIDGNYGTAKHLFEVLSKKEQLAQEGNGSLRLYNSYEKDDHYLELSKELLDS